MFDDWNPKDPIAELGGSVLPEVVSEGGSDDPAKLTHATVVTAMSGGADEDDGMPRRIVVLRRWAKYGIEARRQYIQLSDAETDALTLLWRLVYPKHGEGRQEPLEEPAADEWEYPAQVYRHVKGLIQEYRHLVGDVRGALRGMGANVPVDILNIVGTDDVEALRAVRDKLLKARTRP